MAKMNATQRNYAADRLRQARYELDHKLRDKQREEINFPSNKDLLRAGKVKPTVKLIREAIDEWLDNESLGHQTYLANIIHDKMFGKWDEERQQVKSERDAVIGERIEKLNAEYQRVLDQLYLGDAEEALQMLEAFARFGEDL